MDPYLGFSSSPPGDGRASWLCLSRDVILVVPGFACATSVAASWATVQPSYYTGVDGLAKWKKNQLIYSPNYLILLYRDRYTENVLNDYKK